MQVLTRPFAIEPVTNMMLPDGIFDNALFNLRIACHYTNESGADLTGVEIYLESVGDPGTCPTPRRITSSGSQRARRSSSAGTPTSSTPRRGSGS